MRCARSLVVGCITVASIGIGLARMGWSAYQQFFDMDLAEFEDALADEMESWTR